jgi:hypothetical protein
MIIFWYGRNSVKNSKPIFKHCVIATLRNFSFKRKGQENIIF